MGNILNSLLAIDQHVMSLQYNIKKKETFSAMEDPNRAGQIGRKRKTPEELAAEARGESTEDDGK